MSDLSNIKALMLLDNPYVSDARVEKEANSLIQKGVQLTIIGTKSEQCPSNETKNNIIIRRELSNLVFSPLKKEYKKYVAETANSIGLEGFKIIHCHDFHMLSIGKKIKQKFPETILIYDAHEYLIGWPYYETSTSWINRIKGKIVWNKLVKKERKEIQSADKVITVSNEISKRLKLNNQLLELPLVLHNYPNDFSLNTTKKYFHDRFNVPENCKIIVHSGTIYHTTEQLNSLFSILSSNNNFKLVFVGNRPRFYEVKKMVEESKVWSKTIFFHDYMSDQQKNINLLSSADIGLLHVRDQWEAHKITFSNRFVEYIMAGIPVVGTPQTFTQEFNNEHNCCTFYSENDNDVLTEALNIMLDNYDNYKKNALLARKSITWSTESAKLISLYESVVNK